MKTAIVVTAIVLSGLGVSFAADSDLFTVTKVLTIDDATACGAKGGRGAFVYSLTPNGELAEAQGGFCIMPAK